MLNLAPRAIAALDVAASDASRAKLERRILESRLSSGSIRVFDDRLAAGLLAYFQAIGGAEAVELAESIEIRYWPTVDTFEAVGASV